jgi:hypothetical protein
LSMNQKYCSRNQATNNHTSKQKVVARASSVCISNCLDLLRAGEQIQKLTDSWTLLRTSSKAALASSTAASGSFVAFAATTVNDLPDPAGNQVNL